MSAHRFPIHFDTPPRVDTVSLAIVPLDAFSGRTVAAGVKATIDGLLDRAVRNMSGHLVFLNLPDRPHYVIRLDPGEARYLAPEPTKFEPPAPGEHDPTKRRVLIRLIRRPDYSFAEATTLIRGVVRRGSGSAALPVEGARVFVGAFVDPAPGDPPPGPLPFETLTDARGVFALPLSVPHENDPHGNVHPVDGKLPVTIRFEAGVDARTLTRDVTIGRSHSFLAPIDLTGTNTPDFFDPYSS